MSSLWPTPHEAVHLGRPSKKATKAALQAHVSVLKGEPLRVSLAEALRDAEGLGGQERRFAAFAARELSRHQRLLDMAARTLGQIPSKIGLIEDQALVRYTLWRRLFCGEGWQRIGPEVKLPGPIRPRSIKDDLLEKLAQMPMPEVAPMEDAVDRMATRHSYPQWLVKRLAERLELGTLEAALEAINVEPSLIFRVRPPGTREEILTQLKEQGVEAEPIQWAPEALRVVEASHRIFETPLMKAHRLQVQDVGSQLIVEMCRPLSGTLTGAIVADLCAGAGGKTLGLADEVGPTGKVYAGDKSRRRLDDARDRVRDFRLKQVSFPVPIPLASVDVALLDAPCSGTGSLAREPDQKWKLNLKTVETLCETQKKLLEDTAKVLKPGALLVYATCSLLHEENQGQVEAFLQRHPEFQLESAAELLGPERAVVLCDGAYLQVLPPRVPGGGFFAARLRKS